MKKIFTLLLTITAAYGYSQTIHISEGGTDYTNDTIDVAILAGSYNVNDLEIHNTSTSVMHYQVNRTILNPPIDADAYVYFCTGTQCYSPNQMTTWTPTSPYEVIGASATLPNGPGTYGIAAHYDAGAVCHDIYVMYRVYNVQTGTNDTAYVTLAYKCATGIDELSTGSIANAYPNPASSIVNIKYDLTDANTGKIVIYDMLGKVVKQNVLADTQGVAKMNVADLNAGVYFYSLLVNDKAITTKKLIISSK
jgi:type IX secretion system substrate protein